MSNPTIAPLATARRRDLLTPMEDNSAPQVRVKRVKFVSMLPVRYALGINESDPPEVSDRFKVTDSDGQAMPKKGSVRYTLRRLRAGYLHIYSERDQDWFCFLAHPNGGALQLLRAP